MIAVAVAAAQNCQHGGSCMTASQLNQNMETVGALTGMIAHGAVTASGFSRDQEREADYYGLRYVAAAGYDPHAAGSIFKRFLAVEMGGGSSLKLPFLLDHPATAERVVMLEKWSANVGAVEDAGTELEAHVAVPAQAMPARAPHPGMPADRMRELQSLYKKGLVTQTEYRSKRQTILNDL